MKTIRTLMLSAFILTFSFGSFAQQKSDKRSNMEAKKEKVKAMKIEHITQKLALTTEEAEKFWPIYNKHESDKRALKKNIKEDFHKKKIDEMTDEEVTKIVNAGIELREKELALHKVYVADLKKVLPIKKIAKLHVAEKSFKKHLLKQLKNRPAPPSPPKPPSE